MAALIAVNFRSAHAGAELRIFVNKKLQENFNGFLFLSDEAEWIRNANSSLLALQSNSTGSVLINNGTLGAAIRELKPGVAAP